MRESAALATATTGDATGNVNDSSPPSPSSSEGSLTDDADALAAAIQASEDSLRDDESRRAEADSYAVVEEKRRALAAALAELKAAEDAAKAAKIASGTPEPKRSSISSMFSGAKIPMMEQLRRRRDKFFARRKERNEAFYAETHRRAEETQQRMTAMVAEREARAKAEEETAAREAEEKAELVRRIQSEEDAELRAALEASAAEDAAKKAAADEAEAREAAEMEAAIAASLAAEAEAKRSADELARKEAEELAEAQRVNAIELEKAEYAAATRSSEIYDGGSSTAATPMNPSTRPRGSRTIWRGNPGRRQRAGCQAPAIGKTGLPPWAPPKDNRVRRRVRRVADRDQVGGVHGAGVRRFCPGFTSSSVREAAAAAAAAQKNMLRGEGVAEDGASTPAASPERERAFIDEQRRLLVAKKNAERERELQEWSVSSMNPLFDDSSRPSTAASQVRMRPMVEPVGPGVNSAGLTNEEQAAKREALRLELAKKMKEELNAKRMGTVQAWGEPAEQQV